MIKVQLLTCDRLEVARVEVPAFREGYEPVVIQWGIRYFQKEDRTNYVEVFGYVAPYINIPEGQTEHGRLVS